MTETADARRKSSAPKALLIPVEAEDNAPLAEFELRTGRRMRIEYGPDGDKDLFAREPASYPGRVVVELSDGLPRAAALRLAKAVGLALEQRHGFTTEVIARAVDLEVAARAIAGPALQIEVDRAWLVTLDSRFDLYLAVDEALSKIEALPGSFESAQVPAGPGQAHVLLFRNHYRRPAVPYGYSSGTQYLAGALKAAGVRVSIVDWTLHEGTGQSLKAAIESVPGPPPNIVGITLLARTERRVDEWIAAIRSHLPDAIVAVGGVAPTLVPEQIAACIDHGDLFVRGEGEHIFPEIARRIGDRPRRGLLEVSWAGLRGMIARTPGRLEVRHLDTVNKISGQEIPFDLQSLDAEDLKDGLSIYLSRGCRNRCSFCAAPFLGGIQTFDMAEVEAFFDRYVERAMGAFAPGKPPASSRNVAFIDDDFFGAMDFVIGVADAMAARNLRISAIQTGVREILKATDEQLERFFNYDRPEGDGDGDAKPDGYAIDWVYIGAENTVDSELKYLGKGYKFDDIVAALERLERFRIRGIELYRIDYNRFTSAEDYAENDRRLNWLQERFPNVTAGGAGNPLKTNHFSPMLRKRLRQGGLSGLDPDLSISVIHAGFPELSLIHHDSDQPLDEELSATLAATPQPAIAVW